MEKRLFALALLFCTILLPRRVLSDDLTPNQLSFVNPCSGVETLATLYGRADLLVRLKGLNPRLPLVIEIGLRPLNEASQSFARNGSVFRKIFKPAGRGSVSADGSFLFKKKLTFFDRVERKWQATLSWSQPNPTESELKHVVSLLSASVKVLGKNQTLFFQEVGSPICRWEGKLEFYSDYEYNSSSQILDYSFTEKFLETIIHSREISGGVLAGSGMTVLKFLSQFDSFPGYQYGWFSYTATQNSTLTRQKSSTRIWSLKAQEGGVWGLRPIYTQFYGKDYSMKKNPENRCMQWEETGEGILDREAVAFEFYTVPKESSVDRAQIDSYIRSIRPLLNTCEGQKEGL